MRRFVLSLFCMMGIAGMQAQSYDYLTFQSNAGEVSVKALGTVITFSDGNMLVKNGDEELTFALGELQKFYFSDTAAGIESVVDNDGSAVSVFSVSGQFVGRFADSKSAASQLSKGIYVVKGKDNSKKLLVE